MSKHTPGPWRVSEPFGLKLVAPYFAVYGADQTASRGPTVLASGNSLEDARLIAAAPEMLEALKYALISCEYPGCQSHLASGVTCSTCKRVMIAIKKAEGI